MMTNCVISSNIHLISVLKKIKMLARFLIIMTEAFQFSSLLFPGA